LKVVILAGGVGSRLSEETEVIPKPLITIGGQPILLHIMKHYSHYGFDEFYIALGYKGEAIKKYFVDYLNFNADLTVDFSKGEVSPHDKTPANWVLNLIDTGLEPNTGGRLKRLEPWLSEETFMLTYGDGVSDVNLKEVLALHKREGRIGTVTGVRPPSRFGGLELEGNVVSEFIEKPQIGEGWINGGFMVFEPDVFEYIEGDNTSLEAHVLEALVNDQKLCAYRHDGFWQCMDTLRDVRLLESLWQSGNAPWKVWQ